MGEDDESPRLQTADSVDVEDVELPEDLVRDEADRELLLQLTEVEREFELAERAEKRRREQERQEIVDNTKVRPHPVRSPDKLLEAEVKTEGPPGRKLAERRGDETSSDEELTFASQTGTPTANRERTYPLPSTDRFGQSRQGRRPPRIKRPTIPTSVPRRYDVTAVEGLRVSAEAVENEADFEDYLAAQVFRSDLERWIVEPHFEESVLGCFVRLHGNPSGRTDGMRNEYIMAEVTHCQAREETAPYKFGTLNKLTKVQLRLKRGSADYWTGLNVISNSEITEKEFQDWVQVCKKYKRSLPSKEVMEDRKEQIEQARKFVFTHSEVKKILDLRRKQGSLKVSNVVQRVRFMRLRDYYRDQDDREKAQEYEAKIKELEAKADAQRRALSLGVVEKPSTARESKLRAESLEAEIERRRPRIQDKFEKKLQKMPPRRRAKALLEFYGPSHPLCANLQESDVKLPFLERSPSPDLEAPLPDGALWEADLERDLLHMQRPALRDGIKRLADEGRQGEALLCQELLNRWSHPHKKMRMPPNV